MLFDSPPVLAVADAGIVAAQADAVVVVYESGRTSRQALMRSKAFLEAQGARLVGVVMNQVRDESESEAGIAISVKTSCCYNSSIPESGERKSAGTGKEVGDERCHVNQGTV